MSHINPNAPSGFRKAFDNAREATISRLVSAVAGTTEIICGPLDGTGMFGWQFEGSDPSYSSSMQGDLEYGKAYLRHMVNQGFCVSFAAWCNNGRALVCLKSWEPGEDEPPWPRGTEGAKIWQHVPPQFTRET
jgi:hypothetical protein